ncbi:hypothetical protein BBJ28_00020082 [Nothophytophthora sp. Chile5]|nr:hypothetical protein BBJ28_00020082 [Nothophytophthora sp. Chile5]
MGSKHSRPSSSPRPDADGKPRRHGRQPEDELSAEARAEWTVEDIRNPGNTRRAQTLRLQDFDRFCKFRNYFKNHHMSLAREVGRQTSKSKADLLAWIEEAVGPVQDAASFTKDEILEIAMVSAALTEYGESTLAKMYDRGELDALPNIPLHTHNLRLPGKQQACRDKSDATNKSEMEAAHYIGLEVMLRLNERLPVEQRMGEELREILNHPNNLRLMLASSNQILHKKVDAMLITAGNAAVPESTGVKSKRERKIAAKEYERLVQIAKHAQDEGFQDAMIQANGHYLYMSLRDQFNRLDVGDRPKLWDLQKDKRELQHPPPRSRSRSPTPPPRRKAPPASPEKKREPKSKMRDSSAPMTGSVLPIASASSPKKEGHGTFSRLAAKIFHGHSRKKHNTAEPAASTTPSDSTTSSGQAGAKGVVVKGSREKRGKPAAKKTTKRAPARPKKDGKSNQTDGASGGPRAAAKKRAAPRKAASPQVSLDDSWSEDSDYVESEGSEDEDEDGRVLHVGPRGGKYFVNSAGKRTYVK